MTTVIASRRPSGRVWFLSDRQITYGDGSWMSGEKVFSRSGCTWAAAGDSLLMHKLVYLLPDSSPDSPFDEWFHRYVGRRWTAEDEDIAVLVAHGSELYYTEGDMAPHRVDGWRAVGSGAPYAAGYLYDGTRPVRYPSEAALEAAMRAASFYDTGTGVTFEWYGR